MPTEKEITSFLANYDVHVYQLAMQMRQLLFKVLPGIAEEIDVTARILGYGYGRKYTETICTLIPSKKGLKLGLYRAIDLPDPEKILAGSGKVHKYVVIDRVEIITSKAIKNMLKIAHEACMERMGK